MVRAIARSAGALSARVFGVAGVSAEPRFQKAVEKPAIGAGVAMSVNKHWYRLDEKNADGLAKARKTLEKDGRWGAIAPSDQRP